MIRLKRTTYSIELHQGRHAGADNLSIDVVPMELNDIARSNHHQGAEPKESRRELHRSGVVLKSFVRLVRVS